LDRRQQGRIGMVPPVVTRCQYTSGDTDLVLTVEYTEAGSVATRRCDSAERAAAAVRARQR
jgi:hypothetical protein